MGKKNDKPVFSSVTEELMYLRKQNTGLKGQIGLLNKRVKHFKELDLEGDVMYEEKIAECEELKEAIKNYETIIKGLESQITSLGNCLSESKIRCVELENKLIPLEANIEYYNNLPWIVKMFTFRIN